MSVALPRLVVDASIAIKWMLDDEDHVSEARGVLRDYNSGLTTLIAPDHFHPEAINALRTSIRMRRFTGEDARAMLLDFLSMSIPTVAGAPLYAYAFEISLKYDCAFYDGLYLALTESENCPFVHADRLLRNTLAGRFNHELWIEDYAAHRPRNE